MYLKSLTAKNFRNLSQVSVDLSKDLNLIYGDNAAGKSSFLEAITYLISGRSFRSSKQATFVENSADHFELFGIFSNNDRLGVSYSRKLSTRSIRLNSKSVRSLAEVVNLYPVQSISPESYHLIDSGPNERRKFLDWLLFHVEHSYHSYWNEFSRILKQRNACLREGQRSSIYLDTWNTKFVEAARIVDVYREKMANLLASLLKDVLKEVKFEFHDSISLKYYSGYTGELADKLTGSVERDYQSGNTMYGPHKADLRIKVERNLAKDLLSRGQKKVLINSLFLAQTRLLKQLTNKDSLFIVDDFASELDETNQISLVKALCEQDNVQIIMSCLQPNMIKNLTKEYNSVKMFHVEHGVITPNVSALDK